VATIAQLEPGAVVGGVDTHRHTHVAAAVDHIGRVLEIQSFPATRAGYRSLLAWLRGHGELVAVGVEGCGSWGAGLARHLNAEGVAVVEVNRPNRQNRRRRGKSDPVDAEAAARAVLNGEATATPKSGDGPVEALRQLRVARAGAMKARTAAANQLHSLTDTAPEEPAARARLGSARRLKPDEAEVLVAGYGAGKTMKELAAEFGISRQTVAAHLRRAKAPVRRRSLSQKQATELVALHEAGGTSRELADRYGVSTDTVLRTLHRHGVKIRPRHGTGTLAHP
jgi:transposase